MLVQFSKRPFKIGDSKVPVLPICESVIRSETIKIDRDVNIRAADFFRELLELFSPAFAQDRAGTLSIFHRTIIGPGMNFQVAVALSAAVGENVVGPPAFKISATPYRNVLQLLELQRAIDPAAAGPCRRPNVPVRMIVERNQGEWLRDSAKPERAQVMEVARAIQEEWRDALRELLVKLFDQPRRRGKPQARTPLARIKYRQVERLISPGVVEIQMKCAI